MFLEMPNQYVHSPSNLCMLTSVDIVISILLNHRNSPPYQRPQPPLVDQVEGEAQIAEVVVEEEEEEPDEVPFLLLSK